MTVNETEEKTLNIEIETEPEAEIETEALIFGRGDDAWTPLEFVASDLTIFVGREFDGFRDEDAATG